MLCKCSQRQRQAKRAMLSSSEGKGTRVAKGILWRPQKFWTISSLIVLGLNLHVQVPCLGFAETSIEMIAIATKMKKRVLVVILLENETHKTDCQVILACTICTYQGYVRNATKIILGGKKFIYRRYSKIDKLPLRRLHIRNESKMLVIHHL